jgi:hypothetical protein
MPTATEKRSSPRTMIWLMATAARTASAGSSNDANMLSASYLITAPRFMATSGAVSTCMRRMSAR